MKYIKLNRPPYVIVWPQTYVKLYLKCCLTDCIAVTFLLSPAIKRVDLNFKWRAHIEAWHINQLTL